MNLHEFIEDENSKYKRIEKIEKEIAENTKKLPLLESDYKKAVTEDSANIDELFEEIETMKRKLKADKHKLETLKEVTAGHLQDNAYKVMNDFIAVVEPSYIARVGKVSEEIRKLKADYIKKAKELRKEVSQINKEYGQATKQHGEIMSENNLDKHKLNQVKQGLYKKLDNALYGEYSYIISESTEITQQHITGGPQWN